MRSKFNLTKFGALFALTLLVGCGGPESRVTGVVSLGGKPLPRGTVTFKPVAGGALAVSRIADNGGYELFTGREAGLKAGDYQVSVLANAESGPPPANGGPPPPGKPITPPWYNTPETSGLQFTVEGGSNEINLELTSTPPAGWKPAARRR